MATEERVQERKHGSEAFQRAVLLACLGNPDLQAQALAAAAELAEGMKESHPKEARAALEKVLALTKDEKLRAHVDRLLVRMKWKGT